MQGGDNHRNSAFQCPCQLTRILINFLDNALAVFKLIDRILKLLVEYPSVGDDDDAIENALLLVVM